MSSRAIRPPMGIATEASFTNKVAYLDFLDQFNARSVTKIEKAISFLFNTKAQINASHPINAASTGSGYFRDIIYPIYEAFKGTTRHNYIVLGGEYQGSEWVTSTGYFSGHFSGPLFGIPPSDRLAFLRFGEFHKMESGKITETYFYLGLAELIIALGLWPLAKSQGFEGTVPPPATQDGIWLDESDPKTSRASADLVEGMLQLLATKEALWRPYWHERMVWYGPGGLGSYATIDAFDQFQRPFEATFAGWGDGKDEGISGVGADCKAGDGNYAFLHGWKMITGIHVKTFLGIEPTGTRIFMRDCDWWRCANGKIIENWCMLDTLHLVQQLGWDVIQEIS